jgi:hypothetical protein
MAVLAVLDANGAIRYIKYQSGTGLIGDPFVPDQAGNATETTLAELNTKVPASPSTAGNQATANTSLASIDSKLTAVSTETTVAAILAKLIASPATEATLAAILAKLISNPATETTVASLLASLGAATDAAATGDGSAIAILKQLRTLYAGGLPAALVGGRLDVNIGAGTVNIGNFPSTQPVSGTVTANLGTLNGAATAVNQAAANTSLASIDSKVPASPSQEHATAGSPASTRLSDGSAFYKATTPSDTQPISATSLPLPTGAATETTLAALNTKTPTAQTLDYDTGAGTQTMPVTGIVLPKSGGAVAGGTSSDPIRIDPTGSTTQPVSAASLPLPSGAATEATLANAATAANQSTLNTRTGDVTETAPSTDTGPSGLNGRLQRIAQRLTSLIALVPSGLTGSGNFKTALVESTATVTVAPSGTFTTKETRAATPTQSSVAGTASSTTLLASNANRLGATIYNDSTAVLYVKLGATGSATSYTVQVPANGYYEVPFFYTGTIDGLWGSATGNARVTELSA